MNTTKSTIIAAALTLALASACGSETRGSDEAGTESVRQQITVGKGSADALERRLAATAAGPAAIGLGSPDSLERRLGKKSTGRQRCFASADAAERRGLHACRL
jgi:hypothetical protein